MTPHRPTVLLLVAPYPVHVKAMAALLNREFRCRVFEARDPAARRALRGADLVFRYHGAPRRMRARAVARGVEGAARRRGVPVVNPLRAVFNVRRDRMGAAWARDGVPTPETAPFRGPRGLRRALDRVGLPAVLRHAFAGGGRHAYRVASLEEARAVPLRWGTAMEFVDVRSRDGVVRRWRGIVLGDRVVPANVHGARHWLVNANQNAEEIRTWASGPGRAELVGFGAAGEPDHAAVLRAGARTLGLDVCGIDYSIRPDGRPVLWEANPDWGWRDWPVPEFQHVMDGIARMEEHVLDYFRGRLGERT